jgi:hypothetical protein
MSARHAGRKRKAGPVTLPPLASLSPEQRPQIARARLNAVARPLAYDVAGVHGELIITPKTADRSHADDRLTVERRRHAIATGITVVVDTFRTEAGEETGLRRQRVTSPLEKLWKAAVIDADHYAAARRYQRDVDRAAMAGPRMSVRYEPRMIDGVAQPFLSPMEAQQSHARRVEAARQACGESLAKMLDWIAMEPMSWRQQAKLWFSGASERSARDMFRRKLILTCRCRDEHYRRR